MTKEYNTIGITGGYTCFRCGQFIMNDVIHFCSQCCSHQFQYWQICPKCIGKGIINSEKNTSSNTTEICNLCNGKMIISILTGKPPK